MIPLDRDAADIGRDAELGLQQHRRRARVGGRERLSLVFEQQPPLSNGENVAQQEVALGMRLASVDLSKCFRDAIGREAVLASADDLVVVERELRFNPDPFGLDGPVGPENQDASRDAQLLLYLIVKGAARDKLPVPPDLEPASLQESRDLLGQRPML